MVGSVKKTHLFSDIRPDLRSLALLRRVSVRKDDTLLRAIASELEDEGIRIRESTFGLDGLLVEEGTLTRRAPTKREWRDIEFGLEMAGAVGRLDIGQWVVVKDQVVVAVEAVGGKDEAGPRGGGAARAGGLGGQRLEAGTDRRLHLRAVGAGSV